jgi:hypothetical protein
MRQFWLRKSRRADEEANINNNSRPHNDLRHIYSQVASAKIQPPASTPVRLTPASNPVPSAPDPNFLQLARKVFNMNTLRPSSAAARGPTADQLSFTDQTSAEFLMIRQSFVAIGALILGIVIATPSAFAVRLLYEPFDYTAGNFLAATPVNTPNSTTSPIGYLAPNFNNWYGTATGPVGYQTANDGQIIAGDLTIPGLSKPVSPTPQSLTLGGTGYTFRLSLDTSTQASPNSTLQNATNPVDPLAGTDATLQPSDTGHSGYYSIALKVTDITGLNATGGVLLGFNGLIAGQLTNPTGVGAALTIRPKADGPAGSFQLGIVKDGVDNFPSATWDTANAYTTNSTIFVVGKYQTVGELQGGPPFANDDIATLWINPAPSTFGGFDPPSALTNTVGDDMTTSAATHGHTLQSFVLRQNGTATNNQIPVGIVYDDLRVGTNWADVTPPVPGVPGDFNGNGSVDAGDYVLWRNGGPLANEVTGAGTVNDTDYTDWRARFGNIAGSGSGSAVPEPAAASLVLLFTSIFGTRRQKRR